MAKGTSTKRELAGRIAKKICERPPVKGLCLCSMSAGERCSVCVPSSLDEEKVAALVLTELEEST